MRTSILLFALVSAITLTAQSNTGSVANAFTEGAWNSDQFTTQAEGRVVLFPNPASDRLSITFPGMTGEVVISIFDGAGRAVRTEQVNQAAGTLYMLDTDALANGTYIVDVQQGDERVAQQLLVAH